MAQTGNGYVGIYNDSLGTLSCVSVPPLTGTLYRFDRENSISAMVVEARIKPPSVRMPNPGMAENPRNLFFQVDEFPEVSFKSTKVDKTDEPGILELSGLLTMKGIEKDITFTLRFNGYGSPP